MALPRNFHALYDGRARGLRAEPAARPATQRHAGVRRLAADVPDLIAAFDDVTGQPVQLTVPRARPRLAPTAAAEPELAAAEFVRDRADLWELREDDVADVEVLSVSRRGLRTARLLQRVAGVEVYNSDVTIAMNDRNEVFAVAGQFFRGAAAMRARAAELVDSDATGSIAVAAALLTGARVDRAEFTPDQAASSGRYRRYRHRPAAGSSTSDAGFELERPVRVKDVLFPLGDGEFVAAHYLELWVRHLAAYSYVIAADESQSALSAYGLCKGVAFDYRVHNTGDPILRPHDSPAPGTPHPTGSPNGFQAAPVDELTIPVESLLGDPWLPDNATTTDGNNCVAYADLWDPDGFSSGDLWGSVTSLRAFEHSYNHGASAAGSGNLQSSIVNMFFHVNWLHDRWYLAGFDEAAGNAQKNNFGRGGDDGDPILAEANDFSDVGNARMCTPADGDSPRMEMFVFPDPSPDRTSASEALVTFHEMGHYLTNRLIGNSNGLSNVQGVALGEGWGDFIAIFMTSQPTDDFTGGCFAQGGWCVLLDEDDEFRDNYYYGFRRYPYSYRSSRNPLLLHHIGKDMDLPSGPPRSTRAKLEKTENFEPHNAGEVWCSALWDVFVNLVLRHGHRYAEQRMLHYLIGGLEMTPNRPTFTQARDGIICAVSQVDATDLAPVWRGFAKRGMGVAAIPPPSDSEKLEGAIDSFTIPSPLPADDNIAMVVAIDQML